MRRIYQLITSVQLGGAEIIAFDLAEHCRNQLNGVEITIVELYPTKSAYAVSKKEELALKNIRVITLNKSAKRIALFFSPFSLVQLFVKEKPAVIHSHTDLPDLVLSIAMRISRFFRLQLPKIVRTIHNTQLWRIHYNLGRFVESAFKNDQVVAVSRYAMEAYQNLRRKYALPITGYLQVFYNGCTVPTQRPHPFRIDNEKVNVVFCGRFEEYKGMDTLIQIIPRIGASFPNKFLFHLVGDGTYKAELLKLSQGRDDIILYEPIPQVSTMFYAFDYILMPSHFEGLPLISIEASFAGLPVIASFAPGLDETLPESWPLRFNRNKHDDLYIIFENIVSKKYETLALRKMSYTFVNNRFSRDKMIRSYNNLYNTLI